MHEKNEDNNMESNEYAVVISEICSIVSSYLVFYFIKIIKKL